MTRKARSVNKFLLISSKELSKTGNPLMLFKTAVELQALFVLLPLSRGILDESSFIHKGAQGYNLLILGRPSAYKVCQRCLIRNP